MNATQWAIRCMHEKRMHQASCFLTLTYNGPRVPHHGGLDKPELQRFFKRLRHTTGDGLRYYACGEYGTERWRPHYHALLFNYDFPDRKFYKWSQGQKGDPLYKSALLEKIWQNGECLVGNVTFSSCAYAAGYVISKANPERAKLISTLKLPPEFGVMSKGLGRDWLDKYGPEAWRSDSVIADGNEIAIPRYYEQRLARALEHGPQKGLLSKLEKIKASRRAKVDRTETTSRRRYAKEQVAIAKRKLRTKEL